jgi:hypothetical protein
MSSEHPITPPPELIQQWWDGTHGALYEFEAVATQAARWGADQQLAEDAKWLDHHALNEAHLKTIPVGDLLKEAMRPKPPSLKKQALAELELLKGDANTHGLGFDAPAIRRALEALPD